MFLFSDFFFNKLICCMKRFYQWFLLCSTLWCLFDFYLYMLAMYGLCLKIYYAEYILSYICCCILLIFGCVRASVSVTKNYCSIYSRKILIRSCQHILFWLRVVKIYRRLLLYVKRCHQNIMIKLILIVKIQIKIDLSFQHNHNIWRLWIYIWMCR